jgi:hypothetical protein
MKITPMLLAGAFALTTGNLWAASGAQDSIDRLQLSSDTLQAMINTPDKGIPEEVLSNAKCIVVIPHLVKGGFVMAVELPLAAPRKAGARPHSSPSAGAAGDCRLASPRLFKIDQPRDLIGEIVIVANCGKHPVRPFNLSGRSPEKENGVFQWK